MRKGTLCVLALLALCLALSGTALADYGYTRVEDIPMAVSYMAAFDFRVEFNEADLPEIETNYPYEITGASEMNLVYRDAAGAEAVILNYQFSTGITKILATPGESFFSGSYADVYRKITEGELTLDDEVYLNTTLFGNVTDWVLVWSVSGRQYTGYRELTRALSFNTVGTGGTEKTVYYTDGRITSSRTVKRGADADLTLEYDKNGKLVSGNVTLREPETAVYPLDPRTGRFDGQTAEDLGFRESDLAIPAPAALGVSKPRPGNASSGRSPVLIIILGAAAAGALAWFAVTGILRRKKSKTEE